MPASGGAAIDTVGRSSSSTVNAVPSSAYTPVPDTVAVTLASTSPSSTVLVVARSCTTPVLDAAFAAKLSVRLVPTSS